MAKAGRKSSTWLALRDACKLTPFELLVRRFREGQRRSRGLSKDGTVVEIPADFWGGLPVVDINEGSAHTRFLSPDLRFWKIEVSCEEASLPAAAAAPSKKVPRRGRPPTYDHDAIRGAGETVVERGLPDLKGTFFEKVRDLCRERHIKMSDDDTLLRRIVGPIYDREDASRKSGPKA
jgi:hypothetical protein